MPLSNDQFRRLAHAATPKRKDFGEAFQELVGRQCWDVDARLQIDVAQMPAFKEMGGVLSDADRVIWRNRLLWLLADHPKIRGPLVASGSWIWPNTIRALEGADRQEDRCPRPETELKLVNALVEFYADRVVRDRIATGVATWIEATTADLLRQVQLPPREFAAVQGFVRSLAHKEMVDQLTRMGMLLVSPADLRQTPFRSFV